MLNCFHKYFIYNSEVRKCTEFRKEYFEKGTSVYEVFRLINGVPLFYYEHIDRLFNTAKIIDFPVWVDYHSIIKEVKRLIDINQIETGNVEIIFNVYENEKHFIILFIENRYPSPDQYLTGIPSFFYKAEREIPNAKRVILDLRLSTVEVIRERSIYDVVLVNRQGYITEGSRSNIFFILGNEVFTPPLFQVLPGITRDKVFEICHKMNIQVNETMIHKNQIDIYDSAFFTGTSPKVLPISGIDHYSFNMANPVLKTIKEEYNVLVDQYIDSGKTIFNTNLSGNRS